MKTIIKLLKFWSNGSTSYPSGTMLRLDADDAKSLIEKGVAKAVEDTDSINAYLKRNSTFSHPVGDETEPEFAGIPASKFWRRDDSGSDVIKSLGEVLSKAAGMTEGSGPDGGFAVPMSYHNVITLGGLESDMLINQCYNVNVPTNSITIPAIADYTRTNGLYEIATPVGVAEGGTLSNKKLTLGKLQLNLSKMGFLLPLSNELIEDCPQLAGDFASRIMGECMLDTTIKQIINGTGAGQALGIMNAPCLITVDKESGQAASTVLYENIVKMFARANTRTKKNGLWICSPDTIPQLFTLSLAIGAGGSHISLIQNIGEKPTGTIFGRPIVFCEHCQTLGTEGDIIFANMRDYCLARKLNDPIKIASSPHLGFATDEHYFRVTSRVDGQPLLSQAQTPANGGDTLSSFITLQTRS